MNKKNIKMAIIVIIIFIIIIVYLWLLSRNKIDDKNINVYEVSAVNDSDDPVIRDVYHQFNSEDGILFNLLGSGVDTKYYGYYYREGRSLVSNLDDVVKTYLTVHSYDYKNSKVNEDKNCYEVNIKDLGVTYEKLFNNNNFTINNSVSNIRMEIDNDKLCIYDGSASNYVYLLDTMYVNGFYQDNQLLVYERVAFIKLSDNEMEFYSDYEMNNLIYKAKRSDINTSFVNNTNIVSNVLLKYQDKFNIYTYTFEKNADHYTFVSVD